MVKVFSALIVISILSGLPSEPFANETEAEEASVHERELTETEIDSLREGCGRFLKSVSGSIDLGIQKNATKVSFNNPKFLKLLLYKAADKESGEESIVKYPDLPKGGVGRADYCEATSLWRFPPYSSGSIKSMIALRLRPDANIETRYPTAFQAINKNKQIQTLEHENFAMLELDNKEEEKVIVEKLLESELIDKSVHYFVIGNKLFLPIKAHTQKP